MLCLLVLISNTIVVICCASCGSKLWLSPVPQSNSLLGQERAKAEEERCAAKVQLKDLNLERDQLRGKVQEQSSKLDQLNQVIQECKTAERQLEQRAKQLEVRDLYGNNVSRRHSQHLSLTCGL